MASVGGSIGCAGRAVSTSRSHSVSATVARSKPASATMSPARASSSPTRSRPRKARILVTRACSIGPPSRPSAWIVAFGWIAPDSIRPVSRRPRCGSRSSVLASMTKGPSAATRGAGTWRRISSNNGAMPAVRGAAGSGDRPALARRGEQGREIELRLGRAERREQVEHLVVHRVRALVGPIDLVDHHDRAQPQAQRLAEHELGLRHRALGGIDQQQHAVDHGQDALDLAAEIGVARRVDDVDARALPDHGGAFRQDRDAALALEVVPVQRALGDLLIGAEGPALLEQAVDQGGLAVVDVGDDGDVAQIHGHGPQKSGPSRAALRWIWFGGAPGTRPRPAAPNSVYEGSDDAPSFSNIKGKPQLLANRHLLIAEAMRGRVFVEQIVTIDRPDGFRQEGYCLEPYQPP